MSIQEPLEVDRELARAAERWVRFRRQLRQGEGFDLDPFEISRRVLGKSCFESLSELREDPVVPSMLRWVYRLAEQRINRNWLVAIAQKRSELPDKPGETSHAELLRRALAQPHQRGVWLSQAVARAQPVHVLVSGLWERRRAIAESILPSGDAQTAGYHSAPCHGLSALADAWLDATESMLEAPSCDGPPDWWLSHALGEAVDPGWPARIQPASLLDLFRDTRLFEDLELDPGELPRALAPASFMRALARLGAGFLVASAPRDQPFSIAHDAYGLERLRHGALFGALPLNPAFLKRRLGSTRELARRATRAAATTWLIESRLAALRVLLGEAALSGRRALQDAFAEGVYRCLKTELPGTAAGALVKLRIDDPQRFAAALLALDAAQSLSQAHDEDWFRNPRAIDQLRSEANRPHEVEVDRERLEAALNTALATLNDLLR